MDENDYGGSDAMELSGGYHDDDFSSPGSAYTVGGSRFQGYASGPTDEYNAQLDEIINDESDSITKNIYIANEELAHRTPEKSHRSSVSSAAVGSNVSNSTYSQPGVGSNTAELLQSLANDSLRNSPESMRTSPSVSSSSVRTNNPTVKQNNLFPTSSRYSNTMGDNSSNVMNYQPANIPITYSKGEARSDDLPISTSHSATKLPATSKGNSGTAQTWNDVKENPIITENGVLSHDPYNDSAEIVRLRGKIQELHDELTESNYALHGAEEYYRLLERRLLEIAPSHVLPVTTQCLGTPVELLSRLAFNAAQKLMGVSSPGKITGVASHLLSVTAAQRKETLDQAKHVRELDRQLEKERIKCDEANRKNREYKTLLDSKDRERANLLRRIDGLQTKVISLETDLRLAGIVPGMTSTVRSLAPSSNVPVQDLLEKIKALENELVNSNKIREAVEKKFESEVNSSKSLRDYIGALERQLQGLPGSYGTTHTGQTPPSLKNSEIHSPDARVQAARAITDAARIQGELDVQKRALLDAQNTIRELTSRLNSQDPNNRTSSMHSLGSSSTSNPSNDLNKTESEKAALLDYISEIRQTNSELQDRCTKLEKQNAIIAVDYESMQKELNAAQSEVNRLNNEYSKSNSTISAMKLDLQQASHLSSSLEQKLRLSEAEKEELQAIQDELLETVRDRTKAAESTTKANEDLQLKLKEFERRVDTLESLLDIAEGERDALQQRLLSALQSLDAGTISKESTNSELESVRAELIAVTGEASGARAKTETLSSRVSQLEQELETVRNEKVKYEKESLVLSEKLSSLESYVHGVEVVEASVNVALQKIEKREKKRGKSTEANVNNEITAILSDSEDEDDISLPETAGDSDAMTSWSEIAARTAKVTLERAETAMKVATAETLNKNFPYLAGIQRKQAGWLKLTGSLLSNIALKIEQEREDSKLQRKAVFDEMHSLRDSLKTAQDDVLVYKMRSSHLDTEHASMRAKLENELSLIAEKEQRYTSSISELEDKVKMLTTAKAELEVSLSHLQSTVPSLQKRADEASNTILLEMKNTQELEHRLNDVIAERDSLLRTAEELKLTLEESRAFSTVLTSEKKALLSSVNDLEKKLSSKSDEIASISSEKVALQSDIDRLNRQVSLSSGSLQDCEKLLREMEEKHSLLKKTFEQSEDLITQQNELLEMKTSELVAVGEDRAALQRSLGSLASELEICQRLLAAAIEGTNLSAEKSVVRLQKLGVNASLPLFSQAQLVKGVSASATHASIEHLNHNIRSLDSLLDLALKNSLQLLTENGDLRAEIAANKPRLEAVQDVVRDSNSQQRALEAAAKEITALRTSLSASECKTAALQSEIVLLQTRCDELTEGAVKATERVTVLVSEVEKAQERERRQEQVSLELQTQVKSLRDALDTANRDHEHALALKARAETSASSHTERLKDVSAEVAGLAAQKTRLEKELSRANETLADSRKELIDARTRASTLSSTVTELQNALISRESEISKLTTELKLLAERHAEMEQHVSDDINLLSEEAANAAGTKVSLEAQLVVKEREVQSLKAEISSLRETFKGYLTSDEKNSSVYTAKESAIQKPAPKTTNVIIHNTNHFSGNNVLPPSLSNSTVHSSGLVTPKRAEQTKKTGNVWDDIVSNSPVAVRNAPVIKPSTEPNVPKIGDVTVSTVSVTSPESPGTLKLKERLQAAQARFEALKRA